MKHDKEFTRMNLPLWHVEIFSQYKYSHSHLCIHKMKLIPDLFLTYFLFSFIAIKVCSISMLFYEPKIIYIATFPLIRIVQYFKRWCNLYLVQMKLFAYIIVLHLVALCWSTILIWYVTNVQALKILVPYFNEINCKNKWNSAA